MTGKLRSITLGVAKLAATYAGLIVLFWMALNFRFFSTALGVVAPIGLIILVSLFFIILLNLIPMRVLRGARGGIWPYLITGVLSGALADVLFPILYDVEDNFGALMPRDPGGAYRLDPMTLSPEFMVRHLAHDVANMFGSFHDGKTLLFLAATCAPGVLLSAFAWFVDRRKKPATGAAAKV